jgi:lysyl endopeptidase
MIIRRACGRIAALLFICSLAHSAESIDTYRVNLNPLIDKAMRHSTQFAVEVARRVDSESSGHWQVDQTNATWNYSIRIPTAVSLGFHASRLNLPADGTLTVTAGDQSFTYRGSELRRADFWSRAVKGDQIAIRISVPRQKRHQALIEIAAFQAGYKSLSAGIEDHPHYAALKPHAAQSAGCVENYVCDATPATQNSANASVAIVIGNKFECSGTLLNDVPQDGAPYVLTARHCENGEDAGGDPGAASSVAVYFNAITPCGQTLLSVFDSTGPVQFGATTVVEQQDEWLIRLDSRPAFTGAYYAGWDATGSELLDGYSVEYAGSNTQQYVAWSGSAATEDLSAQTLGVGYDSTYWGVVNSLGSVDHGASGSGLFNANNLVVGSASRAAVAGICPVTPPPSPTKNNAAALYNKLASTWSSTADASSSTGTATLASVLDPGNTGSVTMTGILGAPPLTLLSASEASLQTGFQVILEFQTNPGAVCTATGGTPGDGWSGTLPNSGQLAIGESQPGEVTYGMTCVSGARSKSAQVTVTWSLAAPVLRFFDQIFPVGLFAGTPNPFVWMSNQSACTASGGSPGDGWSGTLPGTGQLNVTENQPGTYNYTLTCGTGAQAISQSLTFTFAAPFASVVSQNPSGLRFGETIAIVWSGTGGCTATGGGTGDGWAGPIVSSGVIYLKEQAAGTYTYGISCGPAAIAATAQVTYTFSGAPPSATLTAAMPTQLIDLSVQTYPTLLTWSSNVQPCNIDYSGPQNASLFSGYPSQGTDTQPQLIAGLYTYTLSCGFGPTLTTSTATINWTQQPTPQVTLTSLGSEFVVRIGGYLHWTTNVLPCIGSGGTSGDGWNGTLPYYGGVGNSSNALISETTAGTYTFKIVCGVGSVATAQATVIYNNAGSQLSLTPYNSQVATGQPTYITWNSSVGSCTGYGGASGDGWNGPHPAQGNISVTETSPNDYTLSLVCGVGAQALEAQLQLYVYPATQIGLQLQTASTSSAVGHPITIQWMGNQAASCTETGGAAGDGWAGTVLYYGLTTVTETQTGSIDYGMTCENGSLSAQRTITVDWVAAPSISLSASTQQTTWGTPFTLTWAAANGASGCSASEDGGAASSWTGPLQDSGSQSLQEAAGATHTYAISCQSNYGSVQAQAIINFSAPPATGGSGSGSSGSGNTASGSSHGGGEVSPFLLGMLALLAANRYRRSRFGHPATT